MLLKFTFFIFAIVAILYEVWSIANAKKVLDFSEKLSISNKEKNMEDKPNFSKSELLFILFQFLYCSWALVGFFSSQWVVFLVIFTISMIKVFSFTKNVGYIILDSIITLGLLVFALINAFHLHIPLWSRILDYCL